nr:helix-turn-helix domain-containing protein [Mycobacterium avium]
MFRLRPTARQHVALAACVQSHRELYNAALQERRDAWAHPSRTRISYGDQSAQLTEIRAACPDQAVWSFSSSDATELGAAQQRLRRGRPGAARPAAWPCHLVKCADDVERGRARPGEGFECRKGPTRRSGEFRGDCGRGGFPR